MSAVVGFLESKLGQAVLGDLNRAAGLLHLLAQSLEVSHGQAGIASHNDRPSAREGRLERSDDFALFRSFHS
jgi:hypothetical protein